MVRFRLSCAALALSAVPLAALAEVPRVVADTPVTASLVALVMGDLGSPDVLVGAGQDAHDLQLKPSQARALQDADLLVWVGPEMTGWLKGSADGLGSDRVLTLLTAPGTKTRNYASGAGDDAGHAHEHSTDAGHEHGHEGHDHADHDHDHDHAGHSHEGHSHEGVDPHAWLNPGNAAAWIAAIGESLAAKDAEHAETYRANAARAAEEMTRLDAQIEQRLAPVRGKRFIVAHDAYGYLTERYGLEPALPIAAGNAVSAGAARLATLRDTLAEQQVVCAFPEANHDASALATVIESTEVRQGRPLDPEGSALAVGADLYPALMAGLSDALTECLADRP